MNQGPGWIEFIIQEFIILELAQQLDAISEHFTLSITPPRKTDNWSFQQLPGSWNDDDDDDDDDEYENDNDYQKIS